MGVNRTSASYCRIGVAYPWIEEGEVKLGVIYGL